MRPTISRSQAPRAAVSTLTWPGCRMSKQPLVKPMRRPCLRQSARCASRSPPAGTIFSSAASDACGRIFRRSSAGVTIAVPFLPTATAAAAFAIRSAVSQSAPAASASASTAATVSPAPETSRTLTGSAGTWIASPPRGTSVMPCSLCVTSIASQSARLHRVLRGVGDVLVGIGAAAGGLRKFLAIGRQQRRAAIDREIGALGIDDHALAELSRGVDDVADHARRQHALGIVGQQHDIGARRAAAGSRRSASARSSAEAGTASSQSARSMWVEKCSETKRTFRVVGRAGSETSTALDQAFPRQLGLQLRARLVLADQADEDAARAERGDVARDIAGAADIGLAALDRDDRRRRFRRNPRHLAIDEFVEHEVADAEHGLAGDRLATGRQNRTSDLVICCAVSGNDRCDRENP